MDDSPAQWRAIGKSVRGAAHCRNGLPNQDAIVWSPKEPDDGSWLIMAVADGHGSAKSFRSNIGARHAVEEAIATLRDFLGTRTDTSSLSTLKRAAEERLPQDLVRRWTRSIEKELDNYPLSNEGLDSVEPGERARVRQAVAANPLLAYGATILVVAATRSFLLYLQLGDGEILAVSETGTVVRPLPTDERLFANETTSLCAPRAWNDFRVIFETVVHAPPALIVMTTDGYANSFTSQAGFMQVGADLYQMVRADGPDKVDQSLEEWLNEASQMGSGDDTTLGIIYRQQTLQGADPAGP
jgi:serine/threonine protein phosphatase PrpC